MDADLLQLQLQFEKQQVPDTYVDYISHLPGRDNPASTVSYENEFSLRSLVPVDFLVKAAETNPTLFEENSKLPLDKLRAGEREEVVLEIKPLSADMLAGLTLKPSTERKKRKKRKHRHGEGTDGEKKRRKRKKRPHSTSEEGEPPRKKKKREKGEKRKKGSDESQSVPSAE